MAKILIKSRKRLSSVEKIKTKIHVQFSQSTFTTQMKENIREKNHLKYFAITTIPKVVGEQADAIAMTLLGRTQDC